jgi:hypothetical protein
MATHEEIVAQLEDEAARRGQAAREGTLTTADRERIARDGLLPGHGYDPPLTDPPREIHGHRAHLEVPARLPENLRQH